MSGLQEVSSGLSAPRLVSVEAASCPGAWHSLQSPKPWVGVPAATAVPGQSRGSLLRTAALPGEPQERGEEPDGFKARAVLKADNHDHSSWAEPAPGPRRAPQRYGGLQWPFGFFGSDTSLRSSAFSGTTPTNLVCGLNQAPLLGRNVLK